MGRRALEGARTREVTRIPHFPCQPSAREVFVTLRARLASKSGPPHRRNPTHEIVSSNGLPRRAPHGLSRIPARSCSSGGSGSSGSSAANCAKCHGDSGQGSEDVPPLVGKGALPLYPRPNQMRAAKFHTALDVALFATKQMPPSSRARARLTSDDYWAILAFDLDANGVKLKEPAGPGNAASIVLHP